MGPLHTTLPVRLLQRPDLESDPHIRFSEINGHKLTSFEAGLLLFDTVFVSSIYSGFGPLVPLGDTFTG
jgi:hypothetical protein